MYICTCLCAERYMCSSVFKCVGWHICVGICSSMWVCLSAGSHVAKCLLYMWVYSNYNKYQFYLFQDWWNRHLKTIEHSTEIRGWLKEDTYLCHPHSYVYHNIVNRHVLMNDTKMWDFKSFVYGSKLQYWVKIGWLWRRFFGGQNILWSAPLYICLELHITWKEFPHINDHIIYPTNSLFKHKKEYWYKTKTLYPWAIHTGNPVRSGTTYFGSFILFGCFSFKAFLVGLCKNGYKIITIQILICVWLLKGLGLWHIQCLIIWRFGLCVGWTIYNL